MISTSPCHWTCILHCTLLHHMSHEYPASHQASWRLRHPCLQKDQGGPKSRGVLGHPQALRSLGGVMHSTKYCVLAWSVRVHCSLTSLHTTLNRRPLNARSLWISSHFTPRMKKSKHCNSGCSRSLASPTLAKYCSQGSSHRCAEESPCSWPSHPRRIQSSHPGRTSLSPGHQQWTVIFGVEVDSCEEFRNLGKQLDRKE